MKSFGEYLLESEIKSSLAPVDETEAIHLDLTDNCLNNSKIIAYNVGQTVPDTKKPGKEVPVNPKRFPTKAVDIYFDFNGADVEIFFDPETKTWDSDVKFDNQHVKLSPEQFGQFFNSQFYQKLLDKFKCSWPLSDQFYGDLFSGLCEKEIKVGPTDELNEESPDKSMANKDVDGDNKRDFTASGRKIVHFSDMNVSSKDAIFFCWPNLKKLDNTSTWKDWKKIRPLCRMRFKYQDKEYGLTISPIKEDSDIKLRGFRGYDLTTQPPVQWLSKEENEQVMKLSLVNKFCKHCVEKLKKYTSLSAEEILQMVNDPDLTKAEVEATLSHVKKTISVIQNHQSDSFKW